MSKILENKLFFILSAIMFTFTIFLNLTNKLAICAFLLVALVFTANYISELYGKKKALMSVIFSILVSSILLWNIKYYIHGTKMSIILMGSFTAVLVASYCSIAIFKALKSSYNFHIRNLIGLIAASFIDSAIMGSVLSTKFPFETILSIFLKDIGFKCAYSLTASLVIYGAIYLLGEARIKKSLRIKL